MLELRKRGFAKSVWVPLRVSEEFTVGRYGFTDYTHEYFGAGSLAVPIEHRTMGDRLGWMDIGPGNSHRPWVQDGHYHPGEIYKHNIEADEFGVQLVLDQSFDGAIPRAWHLNPDLVLALELAREGNSWVKPDEGFVEVARLVGDPGTASARLEIKSEFLRDYLAARSMALRLTVYRERVAVLQSDKAIPWCAKPTVEATEGSHFEARCMAIHEGSGHPFGSQSAIFHVWRTDVDPAEDVPIMGRPNEENVDGRQTVKGARGRKVFRVDGCHWADEWIEPASASTRVRRDKVDSSCEFVVEASGERWSADKLDDEDVGRWLWFKPTVIPDLLNRRGAKLDWYTRDTGGIQLAPGYRVHFGVNNLDLITVYGADIGKLPEWQRRIWVGFNVAPEGGVSEELLMSQVRARPADTPAPEAFVYEAIMTLDEAFERRFGRRLVRPHEAHTEIIQNLNRFRALQPNGIYSLAKDLARLTADSFDVDALHDIAPPGNGEGKGSLKSLERVLTQVVSDTKAHRLMGPIVGIYDLRLADAHLPSSDIEDAFKLAGVDQTASPLQQAVQLLNSFVSVLTTLIHILEIQGQPSEIAEA